MDSSVFSALQTVGQKLTSSINPSTVVSVMGIVLSSCVVLHLTWFGIRKLINTLKFSLYGNINLDSNSIKARKWYKKEGYKYYTSYDEYKDHYNRKYGLEDGFIN